MKPYISCVVAASALTAAAGVNTGRLHISDLAVLKSDNSITLNLSVSPDNWGIKSNEKVILMPAIIAGSDTVMLDPITVAGKRAWFYEVRNGNRSPLLSKTGTGKQIDYSRTVDYLPWMETSTVEILVDTISECNCSDRFSPSGSDVLKVAQLNYRQQAILPNFNYIVPGDTLEKNFSLSGRANIRFMVNKTDIDWSYAGNYAELDSILLSLNKVKDNPDATVKEISLCGYASPEGPYANNVRLAKGRTEVVKEYVRKHSTLPASLYKTSFVAEDWQELKKWLEVNPIPGSQQMIAFIDDPKIPVETKNDIFRQRFPDAYPGLLKEVYPLLRHTDYRITYNVRKYYDVNEIRQVMLTNPRNLSQNELYLLAKSYPQGSKEYFEVFSLAARLFPDDATANLNAGLASISVGDLTGAAGYLERAGENPKADYARGVLAVMNKDFATARTLLEKAEAGGAEGASEMLQQIDAFEESYQNGGVTIL